MRTPLLCKLKVTISPWNSWPDFLKVPIFAMSLLLGCSSPRPSRPRWRSAGRRRSPTHPSSGRSEAEDGGGETFLPREEWAKPRGRKSHRRHCGTGDRGADVLWPDQAIRGPVARAGPTALRRRRGGNRVTRTRGRPRGAKEKKPLRTEGATACADPGHTAPAWRIVSHPLRRRLSAIERCSDRAVVTRWWRSPSTTTLETTNGEDSALASHVS